MRDLEAFLRTDHTYNVRGGIGSKPPAPPKADRDDPEQPEEPNARDWVRLGLQAVLLATVVEIIIAVAEYALNRTAGWMLCIVSGILVLVVAAMALAMD